MLPIVLTVVSVRAPLLLTPTLLPGSPVIATLRLARSPPVGLARVPMLTVPDLGTSPMSAVSRLNPLPARLVVPVVVLVVLGATFTVRVVVTHPLCVRLRALPIVLSFLLPCDRVLVVPNVDLVRLPNVSRPVCFRLAPRLSARLPPRMSLAVPLNELRTETSVPESESVKLQQALSVLTILFKVAVRLPTLLAAVFKLLRRTDRVLVDLRAVLVPVDRVLINLDAVSARVSPLRVVVPEPVVLLPVVVVDPLKTLRRLSSMLQVMPEAWLYTRPTLLSELWQSLVRLWICRTVLGLFRTVPTQASRVTLTPLSVLCIPLQLKA